MRYSTLPVSKYRYFNNLNLFIFVSSMWDGRDFLLEKFFILKYKTVKEAYNQLARDPQKMDNVQLAIKHMRIYLETICPKDVSQHMKKTITKVIGHLLRKIFITTKLLSNQ